MTDDHVRAVFTPVFNVTVSLGAIQGRSLLLMIVVMC